MARMPKAPGLFSITNCWPSSWRNWSPTMRITISVALPAPNGTSTLTGLEGYLSCACAGVQTMAATANKARLKRFMIASVLAKRSDNFIVLLCQIDLHFTRNLAPCVELAFEPGLGLVR